jgi:hypothetical protein
MMRRLLLTALLVALLTPAPVRADVAPMVVVYGFAVVNGVPSTVGERFADAIADEARGQGIIVDRDASGTTPARYRSDALARHADYYLTGTIAPVGRTYSVLVSLVHASTGLLTWNTSVQAASARDLLGVGANVRQVIVDQTGRGSFSASTRGPSYAAAGGATPSPPPVAPPPSTYAVMMLGGSALPGDRDLAVRTVLGSIRTRGASAVADALTGADLLAVGAQACMDTGAATIIGGTLDTSPLDTADGENAMIALQAYDCRTQTVLPKAIAVQKSGPVSSTAIQTAATSAIASYFAAASPAPSATPHR